MDAYTIATAAMSFAGGSMLVTSFKGEPIHPFAAIGICIAVAAFAYSGAAH